MGRGPLMAARSIQVEQRCIAYRFVRGIRADPWLRYLSLGSTESWNRLFLRQGDADSACGIMCAIMAIAIVSGLPRRIAIGLLNESTSQHASFKQLAKQVFFKGADGAALGRMAQAVRPLKYETVTGSHARVLARVLAIVLRGRPVLLAVNDRSLRYCHWVLVIGVEFESMSVTASTGRKQATALLAIDPAFDPPPRLSCFNWKLDLSRPREKYLQCHDGSGASRRVTCVEAMALALAPGGITS
jgi:hypothetical protein